MVRKVKTAVKTEQVTKTKVVDVKPKKLSPPKAEPKVEAVKVQVLPELVLGRKYLFTNADNSFVASVNSFEPLNVFVHSVRNGCQVEDELSIDSLFEYEISDLTTDEIVARLGTSDV